MGDTLIISYVAGNEGEMVGGGGGSDKQIRLVNELAFLPRK